MKKGRTGERDNDNRPPSRNEENSGGAQNSGGGEPPRRPTGLLEGFDNPEFLEDDADEDEIKEYMQGMFGVRPGQEGETEGEEGNKSKKKSGLSVETQEGPIDIYKLVDIICSKNKGGETKVAGSTKDLTVPEFHGDLTKWDNFWATFTAVIDKHPKLSAVNKFSKLRDVLKGVAYDSISHIHLAEKE